MNFPESFLQNTLKNLALSKHYQQKVRHYTLYEHTLLVLKQYECYFATLHKTSLAQFFRYLIVFHDIGKPQAEQMGKRNLQHKFTCQMLLQMKNDLPFSEKHFKIVVSLLETEYTERVFAWEEALEYSVTNPNSAGQKSRDTITPISATVYDLLSVRCGELYERCRWPLLS